MSSDIKSVQETGGGAPRSYVPPQMPESLQQKGIAGVVPQVQVPQTPSPSGIGGIHPPTTPPVPPKQIAPAAMPAASGGSSKNPSRGPKKGVFTLIISLVIVVGAGVVGYFFVFPLFSGNGTPAPAVTAPAPQPSNPEPAPPEEAPAPDSGLFEIPTGEIETAEPEASSPTPPPAPSSPSATHISYLSTPSEMTSTVAVDEVTASAIRTAIGFKTAPTASLKEVVLTRAGNPLRLAELGSGLAPQIFTSAITGLFQEDITYAVYTDSKGSWPVYVLRLNPDTDVASAKQKFSSIEQASASVLGNLYLSSPGGGSTWKDGQVLGTAGRYLAFTQSGASLNYVWTDNFLVLGTSYTATQEAVKRLGS